MAEHDRPVDAHTEREAAVDVRVYAAGGQNAGVDHTATTPFDPTWTVLMGIEPHVHLRTGLGEREIGRTQARLDVCAEHRPSEVVQGSLQVGHRDPLVDHEAFGLMEHRTVSRVNLIGPIHPARGHRIDGRLLAQHRVDLQRRGVRTKNQP